MTNTNTPVEIIEKGDSRVWSDYNPSLGRYFLDTSLLHSYKDDLGKENGGRGENGKQVPIPDSAGCHEILRIFPSKEEHDVEVIGRYLQ